ncbi:MAG: KpsF/GutQ family sugar-phosphate isomerase [Janthinobacterium lividum]
MTTAASSSESHVEVSRRAAQVVRTEAAALERLAERLQGADAQVFARCADRLLQVIHAGRRLIVCGMGKSGLIGRKVTATMVSLGLPAAFLHPAEALHGDLGLLRPGDVLIAFSYSGETEELLRLLPLLAKINVSVLSLCGCSGSTLARNSESVLDISVDREACMHQLAPTASTAVMLALGDALALELSHRLGFVPQTFAELHPGGQLGRRLTAVRDAMHSGEAVPVVGPGATMPEIMHEMSAKRLGMTTIQQGNLLVGVLSDGDLRRLMESEGPGAFHRSAGEVMKTQPRIIAAGTFVIDALETMESHKITSLVVTAQGSAEEPVLGIVHMHDLLQSLGPAHRRD